MFFIFLFIYWRLYHLHAVASLYVEVLIWESYTNCKQVRPAVNVVFQALGSWSCNAKAIPGQTSTVTASRSAECLSRFGRTIHDHSKQDLGCTLLRGN